jgi:transposase
MNMAMNRHLPATLDHDSVWSFITGADERQLQVIQQQTGYEMRPATRAGSQGIPAALYRPLSIHSEAELAREHDRIVTAVQEVVQEHWEVETLAFRAGAVVSTYQRLDWLD